MTPTRSAAADGSLSAIEIEQFSAVGYVVLEEVLDPELDLDPLLAEYDALIGRLAVELFASGRLGSDYATLPAGERLTRIYTESGGVYSQYFDMTLPLPPAVDTPMWHGPAVFNVLRNQRLLDAVESLIGPEIFSNPVQHVRMKPPEALTPVNPDTGASLLGATPWHQDNGVVQPEADATEMITVWIPLRDATVQNGCLHVVPGSHRNGLLPHCPRPEGMQIPTSQLPHIDSVPLPLRRGGIILMHRLTCHGSLPNLSQEVRWSLDLRYNPIGQPTGRDALPGFVARSRADPESELTDAAAWATSWAEARSHLSDPGALVHQSHRWGAEAEYCA